MPIAYINNSGANVTINSGSGDDNIYNAYSYDDTTVGSNVMINAGNGNNDITNFSSSNVTMISDNGSDSVTNGGLNANISTGDGNDSI